MKLTVTTLTSLLIKVAMLIGGVLQHSDIHRAVIRYNSL